MFKKSIKFISYIGILFLLFTVTTFGQKSECKPAKDSSGNTIPNTYVCEISESDPFPLGPVRIPNDAKVEIRMINKSPFDDCTLAEIKLAPIPEIDPIEKILILFTKAATGAALPSSDIKIFGLDQNGNTIVDENGEPIRPANLIEQLLLDSENLAGNLNSRKKNTLLLIKDKYKPFTTEIKELVGKKLSEDKDFTEADRLLIAKVKTEIEKEKDNAVLSNNDAELTTKSLEQFINDSQTLYNLYRKQFDRIKITDETTNKILVNLHYAEESLSVLRTNFEAITSARTLFKDFVKKAEKPIFVKIFPAFLPYSQQTASSSVTCTNTITKQVVYQQIPVTFSYKKDPKLTVSVGPLFSTSSKQKLGITQINTGDNAMGQPTFRNEFAVTDKASYQVIPFAFLNYRLAYLTDKFNPTKLPDFSINLSAGIGVNPNSGTNEVEYFIGPSLGYKKFFFQFGDHIGRFQKGFTGGFNIGDPVPASFPSTLPIEKEYRHRFGIGISYKLF